MKFKNVNIVCFSPTKTTKKVLEGIAKGLGAEKVSNFDLTYPQDNKQKTEQFSDEIVIIGAPVYAYCRWGFCRGAFIFN